MNVTALIVAYHGDQWLPACIDSLIEANNERMHLLLVDNTGNTVFNSLKSECFLTEILKTPYPMGFAEANNYALAHAAHLEDTVLFLNQDTISRPGWIDQCLRCLEQSPTLGAISPLIETYNGMGWDPSFLDCLSSTDVLPDLFSKQRIASEWFHTLNAPAPALIVRKDVLRQTGPFDPVFGSYYEDYDLCRRIRNQGYDIGFCRSARIAHYSGSTTNTAARERKRMRQIIRNRLLYQLRESDQPRLPQVLRQILFDFPRRLARGILKTPSSQPPLVVLKAYGDLLKIAVRLASERRDQEAWEAYLAGIGWPTGIPGLVDEATTVERGPGS